MIVCDLFLRVWDFHSLHPPLELCGTFSHLGFLFGLQAEEYSRVVYSFMGLFGQLAVWVLFFLRMLFFCTASTWVDLPEKSYFALVKALCQVSGLNRLEIAFVHALESWVHSII